MKRWLIWSLVSVATFLVGSASVFAYALLTSRIIWSVKRTAEPPPSTAQSLQHDDFDPEFRELIDFEELAHIQPTAKLVDVFQYGNAYRKSEVVARNGEVWLGLFQKGERFYLKDVRVRVEFDPTYEGYGDEDYVRLTADGRSAPIFLVQGSKSLKTGEIDSQYLRPHWEEIGRRSLPLKSLSIGYRETFYFPGVRYVLRVAPGMTRNGSKVNVLVLENHKGESQVVTYNHHYRGKNTNEDIIGELLWVGDLDRDGKIDLYLEHYNFEKGGFASSLFLSSEAADGKLVREVASFGTAGC